MSKREMQASRVLSIGLIAALAMAACFVLFGTTPSGAGALQPTPTPTGSTPPPTPGALPPFFRTVTLDLAGHLEASGRVTVEDGGPKECVSEVPVKLQRRKDGRWRTIARGLTDKSGKYLAADILDKPGRYRVKAPFVDIAGDRDCYYGKSPVVRHTH